MLILGLLRPAWADDPVIVPRLIPPCKVYNIVGGGQVCGYANIDDYKIVLLVDSELFYNREELKLEREKSAGLVLQIDLLKDQVDVYARTQETLIDRNKKLTADIIDLDKKYQDERVKPRWGNPVAWSIAGVAVAVLAGVLIGEAL